MHDAQNLFSSALAFGGNEWKVDETLDAGAGDGSIREVIVVGVENTPARVDELTPSVDPDVGSGGKLAQYLAMLTTEIKPMVDKELRTLPGRDTTGIMGSSLGGLASAHAGVMNADVFGIVGEMSPSTWWDNRMILGEVATTPGKPQKPARVYVDCGDNNDGLEDTQLLEARYETAGYTKGKDLMYVVQPGAAHNEIYWSQRLPAALRFLFGRRPDLN
jgi:predicted alpha/beta superfamily hydrolase